MIKTLLVFPPVWLPEAPFLSTAILTAYLKERGVDVHQRDLNVEFWSHFDEPERIAAIHWRARACWDGLQDRARLSAREGEMAALLGGFVHLPPERFVDEVRRGTISTATYRRVVQRVSEFTLGPEPEVPVTASTREGVQGYHDLLYSDISFSLYAHATRDLVRMVEEDDKNPFAAYFRHRVLPGIRELGPRVLGISIAAINQVVPALTLARLAKSLLGDIHTVIGGSWCTQVHPVLSSRLGEFPYLDSLVVYEGEEPLYQLCAALAESRPLDDLPNHYLNRPDGVTRPARRFTMNMSELPRPDLDGLPLDRYDSPRTATIQASRGCYWGKCTFCSYPVLEPRFKLRPPDQVADDVVALRDRYGIEAVGFTDALLSPSYARRFGAALAAREAKLAWTMFARLERAFTGEVLESMARSGCSMVSWGLESGSARILELIAKSIDLDNAQRVLREAADAGIHNRVLVMYGHPTEQFEEALQTVRFLEENLDWIHSISYNFYHPEQGTPIEVVAAGLGIPLVPEEGNDLAFGYQWSSALSAAEQAAVKIRFGALSERLAARRRRAGTGVPRTFLPGTPAGPFSTVVALPGDELRKIVSTLEEVEGREQRVVFEVIPFG